MLATVLNSSSTLSARESVREGVVDDQATTDGVEGVDQSGAAEENNILENEPIQDTMRDEISCHQEARDTRQHAAVGNEAERGDGEAAEAVSGAGEDALDEGEGGGVERLVGFVGHGDGGCGVDGVDTEEVKQVDDDGANVIEVGGRGDDGTRHGFADVEGG